MIYFKLMISILFIFTTVSCGSHQVKTTPKPNHGIPTAQSTENSTSDNATVEQAPSSDAGGGSNVGNGGSGIICRDGKKINSIELFDFYEARVMRDWSAEVDFTPDQSKTVLQQAIDTAQYLIDTRWKTIDPVMATYLSLRLQEFEKDALFVDQPMPLQDDVAAVIAAPAGCRREQIVIAREPDLNESARYTVRKAYFDHASFSNLDRAGLILHELLYRLTSVNGAKTSSGVRYMNSLFFANKHSETLVPLKHYFDVMNAAEFPWVGFHGLPVYLIPAVDFNPADLNRGYAAIVVPGATAHTALGDLRIGCYAFFHEDGSLMSFQSFENQTSSIEVPGLGKIKGYGSLDSFLKGEVTAKTLNPGEIAWEWPYSKVQKTCGEVSEFNFSVWTSHSVETPTSPYRPGDIKHVSIPHLDLSLPVKFDAGLYKVDGLVRREVTIEWKENEPAKVGGLGVGVVVFASGDVCEIVGASEHIKIGRSPIENDVTIENCAARLVSGGSWMRLSGRILKTGFSRGYTILDGFWLDLKSDADTEFDHVSGPESQSQKIWLKAGETIVVDSQGKLLKAKLGRDAFICDRAGNPRMYLANQMLEFDEHGCVSYAH